MRLVTETTDVGQEPSYGDYDFGSLPDSDLLDAWNRDQHAGALAALVQRYSVMVLSVCRRRCRSDVDAEDAFQTTFLYLARNAHKIRQPERLAGWLHRVAQRAAVATLKSSKRETEPMVEPPAKPDDPLDRLTQRHEAIVLDEELADLPEHYRAALVMHIYEGHPLQHLADHFGTTIGSIRGRLQRGKRLLARRLRHRGVIPILAFAAANAWTVSSSGAANASQSFVKVAGEGTIPDPPIDTSLLESLLAQGVRLMPSIYTVAGVVGGTAMLTLAIAAGQSTVGQTSGPETLSLPAAKVVGQFGGGGGLGGGGGGNSVELNTAAGGAGGMGAAAAPKTMWVQQQVVPKPTTQVAKLVEQKLDQDSNFSVNASLIELPDIISNEAGIPVLIDDRGIEFASVQLDKQEVHYEGSEVPLRTALRSMLHPHGLRAVVEDEGLVITADPAALVHQGIGTARWVNVDEDAARRITTTLEDETDLEFTDMPLADAVKVIAEQHNLPIVLDTRALEENGITSDTPITFSIGKVKLRSALDILLANHELAMTIQGETLIITTPDGEDTKLLHRVYWLEGIGIAAADFDSPISLIKETINPEGWDDLGGQSTIAPLTSTRPALVIRTTFRTHLNIENFLKTLRESHFGVEPVMEMVEVPTGSGGFIQGFGMGGGGMGGGFGGGGFGGGGMGGGNMGGGGFF